MKAITRSYNCAAITVAIIVFVPQLSEGGLFSKGKYKRSTCATAQKKGKKVCRLRIVRKIFSKKCKQDGIVVQGTCGSGWNEPWVRDGWGAADWTAACREHDRCYETCGKSRKECDDRFGSEMRRECDRTYNSKWHLKQRKACREAANGYHSGVRRMGGDFYRAAQRKSGCR